MVFWKNLFIYLFIIIIIIYFLNKWAWLSSVRLGWVDWRPNNLFSFFNIGLDLAQPSRLGWNRSNLAYNCWRKPTGCELINVLHSKKKKEGGCRELPGVGVDDWWSCSRLTVELLVKKLAARSSGLRSRWRKRRIGMADEEKD